MPAHLCQLNSLSLVIENGRSVMVNPTLNVPTISSASNQCRADCNHVQPLRVDARLNPCSGGGDLR